MRRRTLLRAGIVGGIVGLAGCGGYGGGSSPTRTTEETPTASETPTPAPTDAPTASPSPAATTTSSPSPTATPTDTPSPTATETPMSDADQVVRVAPGGDLSFSPESFTIETGETVEWRWEAGGHNVRPDSIPGDSSWSGTDGGDGETYGSGHTHSHTFTVAGSYSYYCAPHRNLGMTASFTVE